jgi:hypothetical protein
MTEPDLTSEEIVELASDLERRAIALREEAMAQDWAITEAQRERLIALQQKLAELFRKMPRLPSDRLQ